MKKISFVAALLLSGCITIEMPGVVNDVVKAAKDAYKGPAADKPTRRVLAHSYVGMGGQTEAEMKQLCVKEAAQKLSVVAGRELDYLVLKNEVVTFSSNAVANCELAAKD